jgi:hypothetical protein
LVGFFLDLELDLGAGLVSGGGGLAEGGSPPPPAAKAGTDGGDAIRATENSASVASLIADFIMRTSGLPARANPWSSRRYRPRRAGSIPAGSRKRRGGVDE